MKEITLEQARFVKKNILDALTDRRGDAIFDKQEGYAIYNGTDLQMVMDAIVTGIWKSKKDK